MLHPVKAIVLSKIKFGDNDLIVKCYTDTFGIQSYLLKGILKSKRRKLKIAYFQELTRLHLLVNYKPKRTLQYISEAKPTAVQHGPQNIQQTSIMLFLSEVLSVVIKEEESNRALFLFLETALSKLENAYPPSPNFHLLFLLKLTKPLGFYPNSSQKSDACFSLKSGCFHNRMKGKYDVCGEQLFFLKKLLGTNFDDIENFRLNAKNRREMIQMLLLYYDLHLGPFKPFRSQGILNQVFND